MSPPDQLRAKLSGTSLAPFTDELLRIARPCVRLTPRAGKADLGRSRFGGTPDLPSDMQWPGTAARKLGFLTICPARSFTFLAQINFSEVPDAVALGLPVDGWLIFFGDPPEDSRVLYLSSKAAIQRRTPPHRTRESYVEAVLTSETALSLPDSLAFDFPKALHDSMSGPGIPDDYIHVGMDSGLHRLGGYPCAVQGDVRIECQRGLERRPVNENDPAFLARAAEWQLLLELNNSEADAPGWFFGDATIYFMIRKDDLQNRNFDAVRMVYQYG